MTIISSSNFSRRNCFKFSVVHLIKNFSSSLNLKDKINSWILFLYFVSLIFFFFSPPSSYFNFQSKLAKNFFRNSRWKSEIATHACVKLIIRPRNATNLSSLLKLQFVDKSHQSLFSIVTRSTIEKSCRELNRLIFFSKINLFALNLRWIINLEPSWIYSLVKESLQNNSCFLKSWRITCASLEILANSFLLQSSSNFFILFWNS